MGEGADQREVGLGLSIPMFNESALVDRVVGDIVSTLDRAGVDFHLALVDNGSTDETGARIAALAADDARLLAVPLPQNRGYGGGILAGIQRLEQTTAHPVLGWTWGDGQVDPAVLPGLYSDCMGGAAMAKARRVEREDGVQRAIITRIYAGTTRLMGVQTPDVNGCPKLFQRHRLAAISPQSTDWWLDPEVVLAVEGRGWPIADRPVTMRARAAGRSNVRWSTVAEFLGHIATHIRQR